MKTPAGQFSDQRNGIVVFEDGATILHERVVLRLLQYQSGINVLERALEQDDGMRLVQVYVLESASGLHDFATADPYYDTLETAYETIQVRHRLAVSESDKRPWSAGEPDGLVVALSEIAERRDEGELIEHARKIILAMGADQWTYQSIWSDDRAGIIEHRYLIGCAPGWIQRKREFIST